MGRPECCGDLTSLSGWCRAEACDEPLRRDALLSSFLLFLHALIRNALMLTRMRQCSCAYMCFGCFGYFGQLQLKMTSASHHLFLFLLSACQNANKPNRLYSIAYAAKTTSAQTTPKNLVKAAKQSPFASVGSKNASSGGSSNCGTRGDR